MAVAILKCTGSWKSTARMHVCNELLLCFTRPEGRRNICADSIEWDFAAINLGSVCYFFIPWSRHNSCRKRVCGNVWFPHGCLDVSYRSWDKSKNPWPCGNCTFPNLMHHQNLESTQPEASCFPGPDDAPHCEMCDFCMGMGSCYILRLALQGLKIAVVCPSMILLDIKASLIQNQWRWFVANNMPLSSAVTKNIYTD